jgi:hypothetical protein
MLPLLLIAPEWLPQAAYLDIEPHVREDGGQDLPHAIRAARFALDATGSAAHDLASAA